MKLCKFRLVGAFAVLALAAFAPTIASASRSTVLLSQDFSSTTFPPSGWTADDGIPPPGWDSEGGWYRSIYGPGGTNGSAMFDFYNYNVGSLTTPVLDLSAYSSDTAFIEFDYWSELDFYNASYGGDDFYVRLINRRAGQSDLLHLTTDTSWTYNNSSSDGYMVDPDPNGFWRHYKIGIPPDYRSSDLKIRFYGRVNIWVAGGNVGIDNVLVTGVKYNLLAVSPLNALDCGTLSTGDTSAIKCIYLSNQSPVPISISNLALSSNAGDFWIVRAPSVVPGAGRDSICIRFSPTVAGSRSARLSFNTNADAPQSGALSITGTGLAPVLSISSIPKLFIHTHTRLGDTLRQSFIVSNSGVGTLRLRATTFGGDYPGEFSITRLPEGILAGQSDTFTVAYHPTIEGSLFDTLRLSSNGGTYLDIPLFGIGVLQRLTIEPSTIQFGPVDVGTQTCQDIELLNNGTDTLTITANFFSSFDYDFTLKGLSGSNTRIAPDQYRMVTVCSEPPCWVSVLPLR